MRCSSYRTRSSGRAFNDRSQAFIDPRKRGPMCVIQRCLRDLDLLVVVLVFLVVLLFFIVLVVIR